MSLHSAGAWNPILDIRTFGTITENETQDLQEYPHFGHMVNPMIWQLELLHSRDTVWSHYIGQTIATDAEGRVLQDKGSPSESFYEKWIQLTHCNSQTHKINIGTSLRRIDQFNPAEDTDANLVWLSRPDLRELKRGFVLASGVSLNSAMGGMPQVHLQPSARTLKIAGSVHVQVDHLTTALAIQNQEPQQALEASITRIFRRMQSTFEGSRMISEAVFESAVCSATNLVLDSKHEVARRTSSLLLLGPDIPIRDAQGKSDWWSPMAGRAVKLWRRGFDIVKDQAPCASSVSLETDLDLESDEHASRSFSDDYHNHAFPDTSEEDYRCKISKKCAAFIDFRIVTSDHQKAKVITLACVFMAEYLLTIWP